MKWPFWAGVMLAIVVSAMLWAGIILSTEVAWEMLTV